ncbi:MAG: GTP cyclohydrolase I FolE [Candidatus Bipolaricaulia bacterium]
MQMQLISEELAARLKDGPVLSAGCKREVANAVLHILNSVGEDPSRDGLNRTPERVARMYDELLRGYTIDPERLLNNALFDVEYDQMVIARDIEFFSMCEHHLLPIIGRAHVAYLPGKKVVGLSKLPRIVDMFARRLQVQERMTEQIAEFIDELIHPQGVAVVVEGAHMCTIMRGVKKPHGRMVTSAVLGVFRENERTRDEFMAHLERGTASHLF